MFAHGCFGCGAFKAALKHRLPRVGPLMSCARPDNYSLVCVRNVRSPRSSGGCGIRAEPGLLHCVLVNAGRPEWRSTSGRCEGVTPATRRARGGAKRSVSWSGFCDAGGDLLANRGRDLAVLEQCEGAIVVAAGVPRERCGCRAIGVACPCSSAGDLPARAASPRHVALLSHRVVKNGRG